MANAVRAVEAVKIALDWTVAQETRNAATAFLEQLKYGDVRELGAVAFDISRVEQPPEIRYHGLKLLEHLIRIRWDELSAIEKQNVGVMVMSMVQSCSGPYEQWSLKNQTAVLVAEVARKEGPSMWSDLFQKLFAASDVTPVQTEIVAMVLRWLPEDVIVHNDFLEGEKRRLLLAGLTQYLPETMPFMFKLLERHFGLAMNLAKQDKESAKQHAAVVTAVLNALLAYAEWAPVAMFSSYGLIQACGYLMSFSDFRLTACEILKQLVSRKKPDDEELSKPFNLAMSQIFEVLSSATAAYFQPGGSNESSEYAQCLCDSLVALGFQNLRSIASDHERYYSQMIDFLKHTKAAFHTQVLYLWQTIIRESSTDARTPPKSGKIILPAEVTAKLLEEVFGKLAKHGLQEKSSDDENDFVTSTDYSQYRGRLIDLARSIASLQPNLSIKVMAQRLEETLTVSPTLSNLESLHATMEAVIGGINANSYMDSELNPIMQDALRKLLVVEWGPHELVELHAKCLGAFGPYLEFIPDAVPQVIEKLFRLLTSIPVILKEINSSSGKARMQVCTCFLRLAKASNMAFLPHMERVAQTMKELQESNRLLRGEHIVIGEALLVAASASGTEHQSKVLEWLLGPFKERWLQVVNWQTGHIVQLMLTDTDHTIERLYVDEGMWYYYHSVGLFEKTFRRTMKSPHSSQPNPMAAHMSWIIPPLIQLLRCLHSLWTPQVLASLPVSIRNALAMASHEQAALLGEGQVSASTRPTDREEEMRNWIKGIRDSGYNVLGVGSARLGEQFFKEVPAPSAALLVENLSSMEFRHLRLLIHSVITPFVKSCLPSQWNDWLVPLLRALLLHCHSSLPAAWTSLIEGNVKTATLLAEGGTSGVKTEVIEERILRELTREVCNLFAALAAPELNQNQPGQQGLIVCIMQYGDAALAALDFSVQSLKWPDSDVVHKSAAFCSAVTSLAVSVNNPGLNEIVGRDMFTAVIQSLAHESQPSVQAELLGLLREIYGNLSPVTAYPKQVLMSLPSVTQRELEQFENSFTKATSAKEQRQLLKSLLLSGGGDFLKALRPRKSTAAPNVNNILSMGGNQEMKVVSYGDEPGPIGLATIL